MNYRRGSHSVYDLRFHIVFCTKYRYRVLCGEVANRCRELVREICAANYVDIESGSMSPDHVHLLISVPPHAAISTIVQHIKGRSSRKLQQEFNHLKRRYWGQHLWSRGYFAVTVGELNASDVQEYIEGQMEHHKKDNFNISEF